MNTRKISAALITCMLMLGCSSGAQDEPDRVVVSGKVTFAGDVVEKGEIRFVPIKGTQAPNFSAIIKEGAYQADHKGGVPVGTHRVEIRAYRESATAGEDVPGVAPGANPEEQYIPEKYNANSELEIVVSSGSPPITQDYELE